MIGNVLGTVITKLGVDQVLIYKIGNILGYYYTKSGID
jgi:hypothetical protein